LALLFFGLGAISLLHHEMWRDELQAWRIAASSSSLRDLFRNVRYEGSPALWHLTLYVLSRFSDHPAVMQAFHLVLATAGIYLISRFAPFTRLQKLFFSLGYFPLYEYGVISRNYVMGMVGMFAFCAVYGSIGRRPVGPALVPALLLGLVANTSIYGAMLALVFGLATIFDLLIVPNGGDRASQRLPWLYALIIGLGITLSIIQIMPPQDSSPRVLRWQTSLDVDGLVWTLGQVWKSYVPLFRPAVAFWNTNILDGEWYVGLGRWHLYAPDTQAALSLVLLGIGIWMLARTPLVMLLYILASAELLLFMQLKYYGGIRHAGHLFLVFVACIWMSLSRRRASHITTACPTLGNSIAYAIITFLFFLHMIAGLMAVRSDLLYSFSASQEVGEFLKDHHLSELPMIGSKHYIASGVALYLNHSMLYAESNRIGTYIVWKSGRHAETPAQLIRKAEELASQKHRDVLLVLSYELGPAAEGLIRIGSFTHNIISDERYVLYLLCYSKTGMPPSDSSADTAASKNTDFCP
jgi:hypothetical protein